MSKKEPKRLGLADLPSEARNLKLGLKFPTLQRRSFLTRRDLDEVKAGTDAKLIEVTDYVTEMGDVLSDPELGRKQDKVVRAAEQETVEFITACPEATREELATAALKVAVEKFPDTSIGLNHIADFGISLGLLTGACEKDTRVMVLPVSGEDGRWVATELTTRVRAASAVFAALMAKSERVAEANASAAEDALAKLHEGTTASFLNVLNCGGEAVVFVPAEKVGDRFYAGGHVRIRVESGKIIPVDAVGKCHGAVATAVELGISIPSSTLGKERLELGGPRLDDAKFRASLTLFFLLNRGYRLACENEDRAYRIKGMREKATISGIEFVVEGKSGIASLFVRDGWETDKRFFRHVAFLAERDETGAIRVVETLKECEELFPDSSWEPKPAGEKYTGIGYPLGAILRTLFATLVKSRPRHAGNGEAPNGVDETSNNGDLIVVTTAASES